MPFFTREYIDAENDFSKSIELVENTTNKMHIAYYYLWRSLFYYEDTEDFFKALNDINYSIIQFSELDREHPFNYILRGHIYDKVGNRELMCKDYKKACDLVDCEMFNMYCK
jgi:tetratricopeptide (TPR) repeat protein